MIGQKRMILPALLPSLALMLLTPGQVASAENPHYDETYGVDRVATIPPTVGMCTQCHEPHDNQGQAPEIKTLFAPNDNQLCYDPGGANGCHSQLPTGYPASEEDRMPPGSSSPGYFEVNAGGQRLPGVLLRRRWGGAAMFEDARVFTAGHFYSPHRNDIDMPRQDDAETGLCLNCHNTHEGQSDHDLLTAVYQPYGGSWPQQASDRLALCLDCHGPTGPWGMEEENRRIAEYYDPATNPDGTAGHAIRKDPNVAISWPPHVSVGDPLPCYDCHNPHGSRGNDGVSSNGFLLSDQRPGWQGLTNPLTDWEQNRRFCLGCHIPSDGAPGSIQVGGIVMNALPMQGPHNSISHRGCSECHGDDYSEPTSFNVHHPKLGNE